MELIPKPPFYNRPMVVHGGHSVESYIFPTCAPWNPKKDNDFLTSPREKLSLEDVHRFILQKWHLMVFYTIDLRRQRQQKEENKNKLTKTLLFPLQGGPNIVIEPEKIENICNEIHRLLPTTIVIHCTHGLNRTLLLLAALFLKDNPEKTIDQALFHVKKIRPPGILRRNVIDSLSLWKQTFLK